MPRHDPKLSAAQSFAGNRTSECGTSPAERFVAQNAAFDISLTFGRGMRCRIYHRVSETLLADGEYHYAYGNPSFAAVERDRVSILLRGETPTGVVVEHRLRLCVGGWLEEELSFENIGDAPVIGDVRSGFVLPIIDGRLEQMRFHPVPFMRRNRIHIPAGPQDLVDDPICQCRDRAAYSCAYGIDDILFRRRAITVPTNVEASDFPLRRTHADSYDAEAWVLTDGSSGFLISKYSPEHHEYAVLDRVPAAAGQIGWRWGGSSGFNGDNSYGVAQLHAGECRRFGVTRLTAFSGDMTAGYYRFRTEMEERGHGVPESFDPPIHWNELYDNGLLFDGRFLRLSDPGAYCLKDNRERYYTLETLREAAESARDMGCDALYLDPGWDDAQASNRWDTQRLGKLSDFIMMLRRDYGLSLSLHTPLSGWVDPGCALIEGAAVRLEDGRTTSFNCGASTIYNDEMIGRLRELADEGPAFLMFDGAQYNGPCYDPSHGHGVPSTIDEHITCSNAIAREVHRTHPDILIEMHSQTFPPGETFRHPPIYLGHARDDGHGHGFDTRWGFEFMWDAMSDLLHGDSLNLYYYNLAYSLPLYIHFDLRYENEHALLFWWNASTCRHLGFGGMPTDPAVAAAVADAVRSYRSLKPYYTCGRFYGLGEMVHVHTATDSLSAVINIFNLDDHPVDHDICFRSTDVGLVDQPLIFSGGSFYRNGDHYSCKLTVPARGHVLLRVAADKPTRR